MENSKNLKWFETHKMGQYLIQQSDRYDTLFQENFEAQYAASLVNLLNYGRPSADRTGTGTIKVQGQHFRLDVREGALPMLNGKKIHGEKIFIEAFWMMKGRTDLQFLHERNVHYWDDWADENGQLGPIYGKQMRDFGGKDQFSDLINSIRNNPDSRRHMMSLWNPTELHLQKLPPCHLMYQVGVYLDQETDAPMMDMHVTQRSGDSFLGIPYDFVLFTMFFRAISEMVGIPCGHIHYQIADYHMYLNHEEAVRKYLDNWVNDPERLIGRKTSLFIAPSYTRRDFEVDHWLDDMLENGLQDLKIYDYKSYPHIPAKIAV
jgi:thymidylate synthase